MEITEDRIHFKFESFAAYKNKTTRILPFWRNKFCWKIYEYLNLKKWKRGIWKMVQIVAKNLSFWFW